MGQIKIATLIGLSSLPAEEQGGEDLLAVLRQARPDLFREDSPVIDFHGERYVVIHECDSRAAAESWALDHQVKLHGAIVSREETYRLYIGWTGVLDTDLYR